MDNAEVHSWKFIVVINYWREHFEIAKEQLPSQAPMDGFHCCSNSFNFVVCVLFKYYGSSSCNLELKMKFLESFRMKDKLFWIKEHIFVI